MVEIQPSGLALADGAYPTNIYALCLHTCPRTLPAESLGFRGQLPLRSSLTQARTQSCTQVSPRSPQDAWQGFVAPSSLASPCSRSICIYKISVFTTPAQPQEQACTTDKLESSRRADVGNCRRLHDDAPAAFTDRSFARRMKHVHGHVLGHVRRHAKRARLCGSFPTF